MIRELNKETAKVSQSVWTIMTFVLEQDGQFNIDYSYEPYIRDRRTVS
ncbi:DUF600 family protein [Bacillus sp. EB106-08-02-XG196]|nr:DUF600 family protein [Bacillus sp. EB106-08-02-XG196]